MLTEARLAACLGLLRAESVQARQAAAQGLHALAQTSADSLLACQVAPALCTKSDPSDVTALSV